MNANHPPGLPSSTLRSGLALLLGAAAIIACESEDPLTSPGDSSPPPARDIVTTQAAPVEGTLTVVVAHPANPSVGRCPFDATEVVASGDPPTYILPSAEASFCMAVTLTSPPVTKSGVLVLSRCSSRETGFDTSSAACTEPGGGGHWVRVSRTSVSTGTVNFKLDLAAGVTYGFSLQYQGRGNGVKNTTLPPFDVTRPLSD